YRVIGAPFLLDPGTICTETYLVVGAFADQEEAENYRGYVASKFFRFMLWLRKGTQNLSAGMFAWVPDLGKRPAVPVQHAGAHVSELPRSGEPRDYSRPWGDPELYERFDLSAQERAYVESKIKELAGGSQL